MEVDPSVAGAAAGDTADVSSSKGEAPVESGEVGNSGQSQQTVGEHVGDEQLTSSGQQETSEVASQSVGGDMTSS